MDSFLLSGPPCSQDLSWTAGAMNECVASLSWRSLWWWFEAKLSVSLMTWLDYHFTTRQSISIPRRFRYIRLNCEMPQQLDCLYLRVIGQVLRSMSPISNSATLIAAAFEPLILYGDFAVPFIVAVVWHCPSFKLGLSCRRCDINVDKEYIAATFAITPPYWPVHSISAKLFLNSCRVKFSKNEVLNDKFDRCVDCKHLPRLRNPVAHRAELSRRL